MPGTLNAIIPVLRGTTPEPYILFLHFYHEVKVFFHLSCFQIYFSYEKTFQIKDKIAPLKISNFSGSQRNSSMNESYLHKDMQGMCLKLCIRTCHKKVEKWIEKSHLFLFFWFCAELPAGELCLTLKCTFIKRTYWQYFSYNFVIFLLKHSTTLFHSEELQLICLNPQDFSSETCGLGKHLGQSL